MSWMQDLVGRLHRCHTAEEVSRQMLDVTRRLQRKDRVDGTQDERIRALEAENGEQRLYLAALIWLLLRNERITSADLAEVVDALVFMLAGPGYVTGEVLHVDGGRHLT